MWMHGLALGAALLLGLAIIAIGAHYVVTPITATRSFGLPLPESTANIAWWLRLKGVRDIVSGLIVLAFMALGVPRGVGIIPVGDVLLILRRKAPPKARLAFTASRRPLWSWRPCL